MVNKSKVANILPDSLALKIIREVASSEDGRLIITFHAKKRMLEREINIKQITAVMKSRHTRWVERPCQVPSGDWECKIHGASAGKVIELVLAIKLPIKDTDIALVTVIDKTLKN
jgi:hypothetical protein